MSIRTRLKALEQRRSDDGRPTYGQALLRWAALASWLAERGYGDALAAVEAGESAPAGLGNLLQEQAGCDRKHRAWERVETAINSGRLPKEPDLRLLQ